MLLGMATEKAESEQFIPAHRGSSRWCYRTNLSTQELAVVAFVPLREDKFHSSKHSGHRHPFTGQDLAGASGNPRRLLCCLAVLNMGPTVSSAQQLVTARQGSGTLTSARRSAHPAPRIWQGYLGQVHTRAGNHGAFIKNRRCSCFEQRFPSSACPFFCPLGTQDLI